MVVTRGRGKPPKVKAAREEIIDLDEGSSFPVRNGNEESGPSYPRDATTQEAPAAESPVSVLQTEELTPEMLEEEKLLQEERCAAVKEEEKVEEVAGGAQPSSKTMLNKLDELLNKTKCYTEFLFEHMEKDENAAATAKSGRKRKAAGSSQQRVKKRHVDTNYVEDVTEEDEAESMQLQNELAPLITGGALKFYQLKGVKWMISLYQNGLNGILADQMGLGKTVQAIAFLAHLTGKGVTGPFLILAPLSTLTNWIRELKKWCPSMEAVLYHGSKAERADKRRKFWPRHGTSLPVMVTSYEVVMADISFLKQYHWTYVIVDEGHRLKNYDCKLFKELKKLRIENCLLLTGTPLQNNLPELWSLLNFILPDIFSSLSEFKMWFAFAERQNMNAEERDEARLEIVRKLHEILRPFLLRRMKSEVEKNLPRKKEIILYAEMTDVQKDFDNKLLKRELEKYLEETRTYTGTLKRKQLSNICMQLRKNCNHPDILRQEFDRNFEWPPLDQLINECGKMKLLDRLLVHLKNRGHRVLIFSQMTKLLDILEHCLEQKGHAPFRLDGNVKLQDRQSQIQRYEEGEGFVFLLSTRAGGLGINLTSADTAIIYDSDWNPQMDLQAMDRCHRIGQKRAVHVYRLLTSQSVECRMLQTANSKLHLEKVVIDKGQFRQERENPVALDESDLLALLKGERTEEEKFVQSSEISEQDLLKVLDRSDLVDGFSGEQLPSRGPGWEVVVTSGNQGFLSSVEGYRKVEG